MNFDRIIAVRNDKTIFRDSDTVIKVFDKTFLKSNILDEALAQALAEEALISVPKICGVGTVDNKWYIASEYIPGKTLARLMQEHPDKKENYLEKFVDIQLEMHAKSCPALRRTEDELDQNISEADLNASLKTELRARLKAMPKDSKICHGDFIPSNIILRDDGTPFLLDWSHATQGNPCADAAISYLLFCLKGDENGAEMYMKRLCEKSGADGKEIQDWMPIVAAALSAKGKTREREFFRSRIAL